MLIRFDYLHTGCHMPVHSELKEMLERGIIEKSSSEWAGPDPDGSGEEEGWLD